MSNPSERITITLTRYREPDWLVMETLASLANQSFVSGDVVFLDQNWRAGFAREVEALSNDALNFKCAACEEKGLSYARNQGLAAAETDIVLFIDPDAIAAPDWAFELTQVLRMPRAAIAGSRILPAWRGKRPLITRARVVLDQYSILDWGPDTIDAQRVVGAGFALRKSAASEEIYFDEAFGRREGKLFGGEETDLCARVRAKSGRVVYCGRALVHHQITEERLSWGWALRRLYYAGLGRAHAGGAPAPAHRPGFWDWALLPVILPPYAAGYLTARLLNLDLHR